VTDRRPERRQKLVEALERAHLDALLVTSLPNVRYLTGFSGSSALLLVSQHESLLITDFRYQTQVVDEVADTARVAIEAQSLWNGLWNLLPQMSGIHVIGFESAHVLHRDFERFLAAGQRWQWRPAVDLVEVLRERKDPEEVDLIRQAATIATGALSQVLPLVREGQTELEIAGMLEKALRDAGSEDFPFPTIVASGPRSALPHARCSERVVNKGDLLLLDFGASYRGYCADVTRTIVVGRADDRQKEVYEIVRSANATASDQVRAGMRGRDADALARSYIERRGHGDAFGHSLGHGLGLEVHEAPRLARTADSVIASGSVVTIEPGIYHPGWGGVRIEDDVYLTTDGVEVLTHFPRELLEVA
jgi:Xaa-Pro aminopeptidase